MPSAHKKWWRNLVLWPNIFGNMKIRLLKISRPKARRLAIIQANYQRTWKSAAGNSLAQPQFTHSCKQWGLWTTIMMIVMCAHWLKKHAKTLNFSVNIEVNSYLLIGQKLLQTPDIGFALLKVVLQLL